MKKISKEYLNNKYNINDYIWYACYGSNINVNRFMLYINGDKDNKLSNSNGCVCKEKPKKEMKYIFKYPIYFAGFSKKWGGGIAFLDCNSSGTTYGKIYKIKLNQFFDIYAQEQKCKFYDTIIYLEDMNNIPILTFTSDVKLKNLNPPSDIYKKTIETGIKELYKK